MATMRTRAGNASTPNLGDQGPQSGNTSDPNPHSTPRSEKGPPSPQLEHELHDVKSNSVGDKDTFERWSSLDQSKQCPTKQNTYTQVTTTPPSLTPPTTLLTQTKPTSTVVNLSAVESRRLRKRAGQRNDDPINTSMQQLPIERAMPSARRWVELLNNTVKTFLEIFRNPFFVPLCFVLALWYLISSFRASLAEIVDITQRAGTAIGYCFSLTWQYTCTQMQSVWYAATPPVYQMLSIGADVTTSVTNKTAVAVCSYYFGWLILTNLGLDCPYSVPYQPLDSRVGNTLRNTTTGLSQIANTAVELLPYGRQLTWSELWLRETSFTVLESDMIDKLEISRLYEDYAGQIAATGQELSAFSSGTDSHLIFQKYNLRALQVQIESDNERSWWLRLFFPREAYIRSQYLVFIQAADDDLLLLLEEGTLCIKLIRRCQKTNGGIQQLLQRNRNFISQQVDQRGILSRCLGRNEDLTQKTSTIDNMEEYHGPTLDLLGSILDRVVQVRTELSTLSAALRKGHVGATSPQLMVQMQIISAGMQRLQDARDDVREGGREEEARHKQQFEDKMLLYRPLYHPNLMQRSQEHRSAT